MATPLYIYKYTLVRSLTAGLLSYAALAVWTLINWFVLRPIVFERRECRFSCFIRSVEDCSRQISRDGSGG